MTAISEPETTDSVWFVEELVRVHLDGERTGGAFGLSEHEGRGGDMTPLHVHQRDDETFYVLDGRLTLLTAGAEPIELGPGEVALAPRGIPHARRIDSERARYLVIGSPAGFEAFLREAGEPALANTLPPGGSGRSRRARGRRGAPRHRDPRASRHTAVTQRAGRRPAQP
jgi:quercetin dioxygenase-like cupin family protein